MSVAAATAAYEIARAAYLRAADDLRAALDAEALALAGNVPEELMVIVRAVAAEFEIEPAELLGRSRRREHVEPRFALMALSHEFHPHHSQARLAGFFGRDHNMVPLSIEAFRRLVDSDPRYRAHVARLRAALSGARSVAPSSVAPSL